MSQQHQGADPQRSFVTRITDTLRNFVTGLGTAKDPRVSSHWYLHELDRHVLESAYRSDWLARKLIDLPAYDTTREWRTWNATREQIQKIGALEKRFFCQHKTMLAIQRARLYGGGAVVLGVDVGNPEDELDPDDVGKDDLKFLVVLNRYELAAGPRIYNVMSPYYTRPEYYTIATPMFGFEGELGASFPQNTGTGGLVQKPRQPEGGAPLLSDPYRKVQPSYGMIRIHPSRVIEFAGNPLPDWRLAPMGGGWGDSVLQTIDDALRDFAMITGGLASVINDMKLDIVSVPDLSRHLGTDDATAKFLSRWTLANQAKSTINTLLIDEKEKWERIQTSFGSTPELIRESMQVACAAGGVPMTRVMGNAPSGALSSAGSSGGEVDLHGYYDDCHGSQETDYRRVMYMMDRVIVASAIGKNDAQVDYGWNPLYKENPAAVAAVALQKAQTTQIYVGLGLINEDAIRDGVVSQLIEDETYPALEQAIDEHGAEPEEPEEPPPQMLPTPPPGMVNRGHFEANPFAMLRAQTQAKSGQPVRVPPHPSNRRPIPAPQQKAFGAKDYDPDEERDQRGRWTTGGKQALSVESGHEPEDVEAAAAVKVPHDAMLGVAEYRRHGDDPGFLNAIGINAILRHPDDYGEAGRAKWLKEREGDKVFIHGNETRAEAKARAVAHLNKMYDRTLKQADVARQRAAPMLAFLKKTQIKDNIVVYRGLHKFEGQFKGWKKGHVFQDNGVISTSADYEVSKGRFANGKDDAVMEIRVPKGTHGMAVTGESRGYAWAHEIILAPGTKFKLVSGNPRKHHFVFEVVK